MAIAYKPSGNAEEFVGVPWGDAPSTPSPSSAQLHIESVTFGYSCISAVPAKMKVKYVSGIASRVDVWFLHNPTLPKLNDNVQSPQQLKIITKTMIDGEYAHYFDSMLESGMVFKASGNKPGLYKQTWIRANSEPSAVSSFILKEVHFGTDYVGDAKASEIKPVAKDALPKTDDWVMRRTLEMRKDSL